MFVKRLLVLGIVVALAGRSWAVPVLDVSNDVGAPSAALTLMPSNFWAQSFTVGTDGLLSQIDVQLGKYAGATGDVTFELRPLIGGLPTLDDKGRLFSTIIGIDDIPVIDSLFDPAPFVSVDVSNAGIHAKPGDVYAISMRRSGGSPVAAWRSNPNRYADGTGFFRNLLNVPWSPSIEDLGFQTWIDPTPSAPYKLRVDATYDVQYQPGTVSSLIEGEDYLIVGGFPGDAEFPEQRPMMEFPIDGLPAGAVIQGAHLELDWFVSSGSPRIEIRGFAGDGVASFADANAAGTLLSTTAPTNASSSPEVPIDANLIASLVGEASHLGVRMRSLDLPLYVGFNTTEEDFPTVLPPRLVIEYTLATQLLGDFNEDDVIDGADYTAWRDAMTAGASSLSNDPTPGTVDESDFLYWRDHFGETLGSGVGAGSAAVPEPSTLIILLAAMVLISGRRLAPRLQLAGS